MNCWQWMCGNRLYQGRQCDCTRGANQGLITQVVCLATRLWTLELPAMSLCMRSLFQPSRFINDMYYKYQSAGVRALRSEPRRNKHKHRAGASPPHPGGTELPLSPSPEVLSHIYRDILAHTVLPMLGVQEKQDKLSGCSLNHVVV